MVFKSWPKVQIQTPDGLVKGIAPYIISASRATDIPAFHAEGFIKNLEIGYTKWVNPFNQVPQYVSFENARVIVFWTKNPEPLIPLLKDVEKRSINYYFTYTLNDYEEEGLEPNLPPLENRIETFKKLSEMIGKERVIWRFDPLLLSDTLTVDKLLNKIKSVGEKIHNHTEKLVFSFVDISEYTAVQRNLVSKGLGKFREFTLEEKIQIAKGIQTLNKDWKLQLASCCEDVDLTPYGMEHNRCIDDELMIRIFKKDKILMDFLGVDVNIRQTSLFEVPNQPKENILKDKGQRKTCGCVVSKDIGQYNTCLHLCTYCYANHSEGRVKSNMKSLSDQT
ncbi:MAG: DUF1848 domain-containing protein [Thermoplasmata archaeon]|nr:DUF1848 domain-containing protein [Thermoplasmata archaeon]